MSAYRLTLPHERPPLRRRASGFALALGINLLLFLAMLGLGVRLPLPKAQPGTVVIDIAPQQPAKETKQEKSEPLRRQEQRRRPTPKPPPIVLPVKPTITPEKPLPIVELTHQEFAAADVRALPRATSAPAADDSEAVGHGPNGETLYAAEWAREPTNQELAYYLPSNAPEGYGMIACKTYPQNRVDDCIALESHPASSHLARAVLNAAWQFKVRPPRKDGKPMIGEWVRIRIDYVHSAGGRG